MTDTCWRSRREMRRLRLTGPAERGLARLRGRRGHVASAAWPRANPGSCSTAVREGLRRRAGIPGEQVAEAVPVLLGGLGAGGEREVSGHLATLTDRADQPLTNPRCGWSGSGAGPSR